MLQIGIECAILHEVFLNLNHLLLYLICLLSLCFLNQELNILLGRERLHKTKLNLTQQVLEALRVQAFLSLRLERINLVIQSEQ